MTDTSIQSLAERAETALADAEAALISEAAACRPPRVRRAARKTPAAATEALPAIMLAPPGMLATREDQTRYLLAGYVDAGGNAHGGRITLVSRASGARYTYRVRPPGGGKAGAACRKCVGGLWQGRPGYPCHTCHGTGVAGATGAPDRLFVAVLTGSDNTSDYTYLGQILRQPHPRYEHGRKSRIGPDAPSAKAAQWYRSRLFGGGDLSTVEVWHDGSCARCGRDLTDPLSVRRGIGPECYEKTMGL